MLYLYPSLEPGCSFSSRALDVADRYLDELSFAPNRSDHQAAATVYTRELECLKNARYLLKRGSLLTAYTALKSAIEADYCLGALHTDAQRAMECMHRIHLREYSKLYRNLSNCGFETMTNGDSIAEMRAATIKAKEEAGKGPENLLELAIIAGREDDYRISYTLCCERSHHYSLISALNDQITSEEGRVLVKTTFHDKISSDDFIPIGGYCCLMIESACGITGGTLPKVFPLIKAEHARLEGEFKTRSTEEVSS